jgi:outer membrane protein TolC
MNTRYHGHVVTALIGLGLPWIAHAQEASQAIPTAQHGGAAATGGTARSARPAIIGAQELAVVGAQEQLRRVQIGHERGTNTAADIRQARAVLQDAQRLASGSSAASGLAADVATAQEQLRLVQMGYQQGTKSAADVTRAQAVLQDLQKGQARSADHPGPAVLAADVTEAQEHLRRVQTGYQQGSSSASEVNRAAAALQDAQSRLAQGGHVGHEE